MQNTSFKISTNILPFWVKALLLISLLLQSSGFMLSYTYGAFQVSDSITGNYVETGVWTMYGAIEIMKYACPDGTAVVRSQNGVGLTVPAGCVPQEGVTFGYVHGTQTDANPPHPELPGNGGVIVEAGETDVSGVLLIEDLEATGRYLIMETDGNGNQLPNGDILGLYCQGDGDNSDNNDNQEITFVPSNGTAECVAYNEAVPTVSSSDVTVMPLDMQDWFFAPENTSSGQSGQMIEGPSTPPLGDGSAQFLLTANNQGEILATDIYRGTALADIVELKYSTYRASGDPALAPSLGFEFDNDVNDVDNIFKGRMVYEPYLAHVVSEDTWQEWNSLDNAAAGNWWFSNGAMQSAANIASGCGTMASPCTWNEVLNAFPNGGLRDDGALTGFVLFKAGSNWASFDGNVDKLVIGIENGLNTHTTTYDFEPTTCEAGPGYFDTFSLGTVNGQNGWSSTGPFDDEIVPNTYGFGTFGCQSLRLSNAVTAGSFGDQTFSYSIANEAGETSAQNNSLSGGTRQTYFEAQFDLATTEPAQQSGLVMSVSPDRGDGARMSYLRFEDAAIGTTVYFSDFYSGAFRETNIATLDRALPHTIKFEMTFVDGEDNDIVEIYIDGALTHSGTSWEEYYRDVEGNPTRTVDSLLFRVAGTAAPATLDKGFLIDNVELTSSAVVPAPVLATDGDVVLNEFLPNPTGADSEDMPDGEWVELYNNENFDIDLTNWYVTDASGVVGNTVFINATTSITNISSGTTTIPANGFMVVYMNKQVLNNTGDTVKLFDSASVEKDSHEYDTSNECTNTPTPGDENVDDSTGACGTVPVGKSFARFIDGTGPWVDPEPTPGEENRFSRQDLVDSGFSDEMIAGMVAILAARGEYLLGEGLEELVETSTSTLLVIVPEISTTTPGVILEDVSTSTPAVITDDTTGGGGGDTVLDDEIPLATPEEDEDEEIKKDDDEADVVGQDQTDGEVVEELADNAGEDITGETDNEPVADDKEEPEDDEPEAEVVSETE